MAKTKKIDVEALTLQMDQVVRNLKQLIAKHIEHGGLDITADQWILLKLVATNSGLTQKQLAQAAGKDKPTVTRMLELMIKKDWVVKEPTPGDRRSYLILPTKSGQEAYRLGREHADKAMKQIWKKVGTKEKKATQKTIVKLLEQLS